jgi:hypothetical protein
MTSPFARKIAARYQVRLIAREVYAASRPLQSRTAGLQHFTVDVLEAFGQGFVEPLSKGRIAASLVTRKLKNLVSLFSKVPRLWGQLKKTLLKDAPDWEGVKSLPAIIKWLPSKIHQLMVDGAKYASRFIDALFKRSPFDLLAAGSDSLLSVNGLLNRILDHLKAKAPQQFKVFASKVGGYVEGKVLSAAAWVKESFPALVEVGSKVLNNPLVIWALYWYIWNRVQEFEWDAASLAKAAVGALTFEDLWASLPGSAIGKVLTVLTGGVLDTYALLPYALLARIAFALASGYLRWNGGKILPDWERLESTLGLKPDFFESAGLRSV